MSLSIATRVAGKVKLPVCRPVTLYSVLLFTFVLALSLPVIAQDIYGHDYKRDLHPDGSWKQWREDPLRLSVKFDRFESHSDFPLLSDDALVPAYRQHHRPVHKNVTREYDATFFYPLKKSGMNLDLGVNIRFLNGYGANHLGQQYSFTQTLPMFYAAMLFDLPYKGLSAGFEGRHMEYDSDLAYEYRAKVRYQWGESLGLQGGWQHQFLGLEQFNSITSEFENEGPYLDVYMNF